jgi:hypothetical protein
MRPSPLPTATLSPPLSPGSIRRAEICQLGTGTGWPL